MTESRSPIALESMSQNAKVSPQAFVESLRQQTEEFLQSVMKTVNDAPDGEWIDGSEEGVRDLAAEFRQRVFQAAVQGRVDAAEAAFPPPQETILDPVTKRPVTKTFRNKGRQKTSVLTINGRVHLSRRWWSSVESGSVVPADVRLNRSGTKTTPGVREMAARLNNDAASFDRAANNLCRTAQVSMSGEQLRQLVQADGRAILAAQQTGEIPTAFTATDCAVDPAQPGEGTRVYNGVDGVMVPVIQDQEKALRRTKVEDKRKSQNRPLDDLPPRSTGCDEAFKEFKAIVFYDERGDHWHETLRFCRRPETGDVVRHEAGRLNFSAADERVSIVDGATWIREQLEELHPDRLPLDGLGLDFYHLAENVHRCRRDVFGSDDADGQTWATNLLHQLRHDGYEAAWETLLTWRVSLNRRGQTKKQAADRLLNYVQERQSMISCPEFREQGWQIGSGPTESRCKTTTSRLKGRGRRWNPLNAEATAAHTTLRDSKQWNIFWNISNPKYN